MISAECWDWDKKVIMRGNSGCKSDNSFADGNSVPERTLFLTAHKASNARLRITRWTKHKEVDDWQEQYAFLLHGDRSRRFLRSSSPSLSPAGTWALTQPITLPICYLTAITSRTVTGKDGEHCFRENVIFPTSDCSCSTDTRKYRTFRPQREELVIPCLSVFPASWLYCNT